ncbi:polar amino acid transport system substrate-binding protein [Amphibacillus marinus]|uniref:Polar amino acid transport system substrate-binding protein n=1 Tax=Amphibacillus marinus TaxID=872970 RepID=A0A1H8IFJ5_9BACI|nr:transporter substrate-binding domain-containing protein [Amphibacillus marinus]SEN67294.1 polar amino acid transport system substrate-binding protein [Amphibacillus marinus]
MKKNLLMLLMAAMLTLVLVACGTSSEDDQVDDQTTENTEEPGEGGENNLLIMATSADYPPFESIDESGEFEGFDIELARYIAEELGYELEIRDMNFDGLIGALQAERVDMVLSGMSATEERKENVDFSIEYHRSGEMFVTRADSDIEGIEDLDGIVLGVQLGTIQEEGALVLQEDYDFEISALDDAQVLIQELLTNRIDVVYLDKQVAHGFIEAQGLTGFDDPTRVSPGMAIAFPIGSDLVDEINAVLEEALENGKIAELEDEWLLDIE